MVNIKPLISIVTKKHIFLISSPGRVPLRAASLSPHRCGRRWRQPLLRRDLRQGRTGPGRRGEKKFGAVEGRSWATKNGDNSEKLKTWTKDGLDDLSRKHPRTLGYMQFWSFISMIQLGIYPRKTWLLVIKFGLLLIRIGLLLIELGI